MSVLTWTRDGAPASCYPASAPCVLLGHGGGGVRWGRSHPMAQWALRRAPIVHSLQLPFHGDDAQREMGMPFDTQEEKRRLVAELLMRRVESVLSPLVKGRYVIAIAYSTSGLLLTSLWPRLLTQSGMHPCSLLLSIGAGLSIGSTGPSVQSFWSEQTVESDPRKHALMRRMHSKSKGGRGKKGAAAEEGEDDASWRCMQRLIQFASGQPDSGCFTTKEQRKELFLAPVHSFVQRRREEKLSRQQNQPSTSASSLPSSSSPPAPSRRPCAHFRPHYVFILQAASDEPFPPEECVAEPLREVMRTTTSLPSAEFFHASTRRDLVAERLRVIGGGIDPSDPHPPATHFNYFMPRVRGGYLEQVMQRVEELVDTYGERETMHSWEMREMHSLPPQPSMHASTPASARAPATAAAPPTSLARRRILIVGCGAFGVSTAHSLARRFPSAVLTLLESSDTFPNPRGGSVDASRIVRADYGSDPTYTAWALESMKRWRAENELQKAREGVEPGAEGEGADHQDVYHETGVLFLTHPSSMQLPPPDSPVPPPYEASSVRTLQSPPFSLPLLPLTRPVLQEHFPYWASTEGKGSGYFNPHGGWVHAERAMQLAMERLLRCHTNVQLRTGVHVVELLKTASPSSPSPSSSAAPTAPHSAITGVRTAAGECIHADLVILATGCWVSRLLPELAETIWPSAQPVLYVRPHGGATEKGEGAKGTKGEKEKIDAMYRDAPSRPIDPALLSVPSTAPSPTPTTLRTVPFPVFSFDLSREGWYGFPASCGRGSQDRLVKLGHHGPGIPLAQLHERGADADPRHRALGVSQLRACARFVRKHMPALWTHGEVVAARTCFYADSLDGHWLLAPHPSTDGLFVLSGGSGHAFKFMPVLGDVAAGVICGDGGAEGYRGRFRWRTPAAPVAASSSVSASVPPPARLLDVCRSPVVSGSEAELGQLSGEPDGLDLLGSEDPRAPPPSRFLRSLREMVQRQQANESQTRRAKL